MLDYIVNFTKGGYPKQRPEDLITYDFRVERHVGHYARLDLECVALAAQREVR